MYFKTLDLIRSAVNLRNTSPGLRVLVAVGGYNEALVPVWSAMAANSGSRENFARNILSFLQQFNLNGVGESASTSYCFL